MKKQPEQGISRRKALILGGAALAGGLWYALAQRGDAHQKEDPRVTQERQRRLEQMLTDPRLDNVRPAIGKVVYSPDFGPELDYHRELKKAYPADHPHQRAIDDSILLVQEAAEFNRRAAGITDLTRLTEHYGTTRKQDLTYFTPAKSIVFITDRAMDSPVMSDEGRVSVLFHEGLHAVTFRIGIVFDEAQTRFLLGRHGKREIPNEVMTDKKLMDALMEVQCYREQIRLIDNGTFKVNTVFRKGQGASLEMNIGILRDYAKLSGPQGYFSQAMLNNTATDIRIPEQLR